MSKRGRCAGSAGSNVPDAAEIARRSTVLSIQLDLAGHSTIKHSLSVRPKILLSRNPDIHEAKQSLP
jgi:hypothetical protein